METKPYIVHHKPSGRERLVLAKSRNSARRATAEDEYEVRTPSYKELMEFGKLDATPLDASAADDGEDGE